MVYSILEQALMMVQVHDNERIGDIEFLESDHIVNI